jgi:hypothetical protein
LPQTFRYPIPGNSVIASTKYIPAREGSAHRHYDLESKARGLREDLNRALERIRDLETSRDALVTVLRLEAARHDDVRRAGMADQPWLGIAEELAETLETVAAVTERGWVDDEGPEPEPDEYDPGPEVDDEGGMSEYRYAVLPAEEEL